MFQPLECFVGLRYLRSRRHRGIVSFMSTASLLGIALGVAALIVILSVMNGFETELRTRLLSMSSHATVAQPVAGIADWPDLKRRLEADDDVVGVAPYVQIEGMLAAGPNLRPSLVRGVHPDEEGAVSDFARIIDPVTLEQLQGGAQRIVLGRILAAALGVDVGGRINLLVPNFENGRPAPKLAGFVVAGTFEAGIQDHDANLALVHIDDASELAGLGQRPEGLAVRLDEPMAAGVFQQRVSGALGDAYRYSNWTEEHRSYFRAIRIEKTMMTVILMFIVAVAAFNIVASLMMVVTEKERDIAILRTCGLEPERVARIFFVQGSVIGLAGTVLGTLLGIGLALNVETIVPWLETTFNFRIMPGDVYYVTEIPAEIHTADVVLIPILALLVAVLATVYPSRRAAAVAPAQALRYE